MSELRKPNGTVKLLMTSLLSIILLSTLGFAGWVVKEVQSADASIRKHEKLSGHTGTDERIKGMEQDIGEVKTDLREIKRDVTKILRQMPR
jgi:Tfp pilus assembly protein PilO